MGKILVCDSIAEEAIEILRSSGHTVIYEPNITQQELLRRVVDIDAIVVRSRTRVTAEVINLATKLRVIARAGVGLDNIDTNAANNRGVQVVNSPDSLTNAVAEHALALFLSVARQISYAHRMMMDGEWPKSSLMGVELSGKILGVIGFGRIGRRLAQLSRPFNMTVLAYDVISPPEDLLRSTGARMVGLDELLRNSDFISIHLPATAETEKMIGERELSVMKPNAIIVNTSRGTVIDEPALVKFLKNGRIKGAGLDVFSEEPPKGEILRLNNVVLTPHIAGQTIEAQVSAGTTVARKVLELLS
jgi:D-3-phosphoglycerate dehydrogenase